MSNKYDMGESIIGAILSGGPFYQNPIVLISIFNSIVVIINTAKTNNRRRFYDLLFKKVTFE